MRGWRSVLVVVLLLASASVAPAQTLVKDVRAAIAANDLPAADALVAQYRAQRGTTPEALAGLSWTARGALNAKQYDRADTLARDTEALVLPLLKTQPLTSEPNLVVALGAALEVQAKVLAETNQRASAVTYLRKQIATWRNTPIHMRLTKNLNLISLEGQKAPALSAREFLGPRMPDMKGRDRKSTRLNSSH